MMYIVTCILIHILQTTPDLLLSKVAALVGAMVSPGRRAACAPNDGSYGKTILYAGGATVFDDGQDMGNDRKMMRHVKKIGHDFGV